MFWQYHVFLSNVPKTSFYLEVWRRRQAVCYHSSCKFVWRSVYKVDRRDIWGSHSGVEENRVFWDVSHCRSANIPQNFIPQSSGYSKNFDTKFKILVVKFCAKSSWGNSKSIITAINFLLYLFSRSCIYSVLQWAKIFPPVLQIQNLLRQNKRTVNANSLCQNVPCAKTFYKTHNLDTIWSVSHFSQMKHQLDVTLCRFYFCRVTLHGSGASAHHQEYLKLVQRPLVHVFCKSI